ncbi:MAG TPA: DinB family protein [Rubrivivax sp.]
MRRSLWTSPLRTHLSTMARYNQWATQQLFDHVDALPEADYRHDSGLPFKSVHGTLNHLLVGEHLLWFRRFAFDESPALRLDHEAESDRYRLRDRLLAGAAAWLPLLDDWPEDRLAGMLRYKRTTGERVSLPFAATLAHVFNHGTHHRGQVTAAITAMGHRCPEIDLVWMLQAEGKAGQEVPQ